MEFPAQDVDTLRVTPNGDILYVDPPLLAPDTESPDLPAAPDNVFQLHSRPGSSNVFFIDFDGMVITDSWWNKNADPHVALPYDPSGNGPDFTAEELSRIYNIWQRVSEDFAAFDIDITTEEPAVFTPTTGRILVTRNNDAAGVCIYYCGVGGIAYVGYFGASDYVAKFSPALVFWDNLTNGTASYTAEASSHEAGHNLGLSHDGIIDGASYWKGHGAGLISLASIMGASYYKNVTQWSRGDYEGANNQQDDLAIIAGFLGYAPDTDGIIGSSTDVDTQFIDVSEAGALEITVTPRWGQYETPITDRRGANLDIRATLIDPAGTAVVFDNPLDTQAAITVDVQPGRYMLQITGAGSINYDDYASLGYYSVDLGSTPQPPDNQPPEAAIAYLPTILEYRKGRGLDITFDGSESTDSDGEITSYRWKINGRLASSSRAFTTNKRRGTYTVSLTVTDDQGAQGITAQQITVKRVKR
jgi:hypothetical protein